MSDKPLVTIGLPVYNSATYLRQSIESLLGQTWSDFILIISDNASTDGTTEICLSYAQKDPRIRYYRNDENIGLPRNFTRVANLTETKYLKWSTADDYNDPTFVEKALAVMEQDPSIVLCYPKTIRVDKDGENPRPYEDNLHLIQDDPSDRFRESFARIGLAHQLQGLIRVSLLKRTHLYQPYLHSDVDLLAELTLYGKFYELPERLYYRRLHPECGSWKRGDLDHQKKYYLAARDPNPSIGFRRKWRRQQSNYAAVLSAPIPLYKKLDLCAWLSVRLVKHAIGQAGKAVSARQN